MEIIDIRTATTEDFADCYRYILNATCKKGGMKTVNGRSYTVLEFDTPVGRRFALGHPAISFASRIGNTMTFEYYTDRLSVVDETTGVVYHRLAIDPTDEEIEAYRERIQRAEARKKAFEDRPKAHGIKYFD